MASTCGQYTLNGMGQVCGGSVAGLKELYIGLAREWEVTTGTGHTATVAKKSGAPSGASFYSYFITEESSSLSSTLTVNNQNGVKYYTNSINATFLKMTPARHIEFMSLANEKLIVVAVDNNGEAWLLGADAPASMAEGTAQSGQAFDDLSGYQATISQRSGYLPYSVDVSTLTIHTPDVVGE